MTTDVNKHLMQQIVVLSIKYLNKTIFNGIEWDVQAHSARPTPSHARPAHTGSTQQRRSL